MNSAIHGLSKRFFLFLIIVVSNISYWISLHHLQNIFCSPGISNETGKMYKPSENDEVEDLYQLLQDIKEKCEIEAVSVGAILSDYQRVRVENV